MPSWAAMVPTNETGMGAIFDLDFDPIEPGTQNIDIRFSPELDYVNASLVEIDDTGEWSMLTSANLVPDSSIVEMFFVEEINWCGSAGPAAIGCGSQGGNTIAIEIASATEGDFGTVLYSHELGHNLDLEHDGTADNLMRGTINTANMDLTSTQIETIWLDIPGIIQFDADLDQNFIQITPIVVVAASTIPLPSALLLCVGAIGAVGVFVRRTET